MVKFSVYLNRRVFVMGNGYTFKGGNCFGNVLASEKRSTLKGKNLLPRGANSFLLTVLALREVWESETPKNCPGTSKNQCQEVWDSQVLKISDHL